MKAGHDDIVTIDLIGHKHGTPLGMLLAPASLAGTSMASVSTVTILAGWERLPDSNKLGTIQRTGQVRLGDRLVRINNVDVTKMTFREVMDLLKKMVGGSRPGGADGLRLRSISFAHNYFSTRNPSLAGLRPLDTQSQTQNEKLFSFKSSICRAKVRSNSDEIVTKKWSCKPVKN